MSEWTKTPPTEPGWYLIYWDIKELELVEVKNYQGKLAIFYPNKKRPTYKYIKILACQWQGPLQMPELPEEYL